MRTTPQVQLMSKGRTLKTLTVAALINRYRYLNTGVVYAARLSHNSKQHGILLIIIMTLGGLFMRCVLFPLCRQHLCRRKSLLLSEGAAPGYECNQRVP